MNTATPVTSGAQSLRRALDILRLLSRHHEEGMRLSDVIEASGLERSTVHRMLACLVEEEFAEKNELTKRYHLGTNAMQIGFATMRKMPVIDKIRPLMQRLSRMSGDTVFLLARNGDQTLCLHREEGPFPIKVFTTRVGEQRTLGIGAAGLAILASLDDEDIEALYRRRKADFNAARVEQKKLMDMVTRARDKGWAEVVGTVTEGTAGVGLVLPVGDAKLAISVGAIALRMGEQRRMELANLMRDCVDSHFKLPKRSP